MAMDGFQERCVWGNDLIRETSMNIELLAGSEKPIQVLTSKLRGEPGFQHIYCMRGDQTPHNPWGVDLIIIWTDRKQEIDFTSDGLPRLPMLGNICALASEGTMDLRDILPEAVHFPCPLGFTCAVAGNGQTIPEVSLAERLADAANRILTESALQTLCNFAKNFVDLADARDMARPSQTTKLDRHLSTKAKNVSFSIAAGQGPIAVCVEYKETPAGKALYRAYLAPVKADGDTQTADMDHAMILASGYAGVFNECGVSPQIMLGSGKDCIGVYTAPGIHPSEIMRSIRDIRSTLFDQAKEVASTAGCVYVPKGDILQEL